MLPRIAPTAPTARTARTARSLPAQAMASGMVLTLSLWDDHFARMLWLDSTYPPDANATTPGVLRGSCSTDSGQPAQVKRRDAMGRCAPGTAP